VQSDECVRWCFRSDVGGVSFDAGASQASQCGDKRQLEKHPVQILKMLCNDNEIIKWRGHLYNVKGP